MKIATIIGARPQFIKAAALSRLLKAHKSHEEIIINTGQHYDHNMSTQFFDELEIPTPAYNLNIGSGLHGAQTGAMLTQIEQVLLKEKPDYVLVYGDTNSTLAGALAASKLHIPVAHVEAGLRSYNKKMPEEINRILTDNVSGLLFTPTDAASKCLYKEGFDDNRIVQVGDVMYDVALYYGEKAMRQSTVLHKLNLKPKDYLLSTIHRAENTDNVKRLKNIVNVLCSLAKEQSVVLLLHPRTKKYLELFCLYAQLNESVTLIEPQGFLDMIALEKNASAIITDSGGVQKEAFFHQTPCITLRDETEWTELVALGCNHLCSPALPLSKLTEQVTSALNSKGDFSAKPYGDGKSVERIIDALSCRN